MVGGFVVGMARLAIGEAGMVEDDGLPVDGADVAVGALPGVVVDGFVGDMAGLAVGKPCVVKRDALPIGDIGVAGGTFAGVMVEGFVGLMTTAAFGDTRVVEVGYCPIGCVAVAGGTLSLKMCGGFVFQMATATFGDSDVVKLVRFPVFGEVAVGTFAGEVVGGWGVATATFGGGVVVFAAGVAGGTLHVVPIGEGEKGVVYLAEERNVLPGDAGGAAGGVLGYNGRYFCQPIRNH